MKYYLFKFKKNAWLKNCNFVHYKGVFYSFFYCVVCFGYVCYMLFTILFFKKIMPDKEIRKFVFGAIGIVIGVLASIFIIGI